MHILDPKSVLATSIKYLKRQVKASKKQMAEMQATVDALVLDLKSKEEALPALLESGDINEGIESCNQSIAALFRELALAIDPAEQTWITDKIYEKNELKRNLFELLPCDER